MDLGEQITTAMMMSKVTDDEGSDLLDVHLRVCRYITCPVTGLVLDSRSALLVKEIKPDGSTVVHGVIHPSAREAITAMIDAGSFEAQLDGELALVDPAPIWQKVWA